MAIADDGGLARGRLPERKGEHALASGLHNTRSGQHPRDCGSFSDPSTFFADVSHLELKDNAGTRVQSESGFTTGPRPVVPHQCTPFQPAAMTIWLTCANVHMDCSPWRVAGPSLAGSTCAKHPTQPPLTTDEERMRSTRSSGAGLIRLDLTSCGGTDASATTCCSANKPRFPGSFFLSARGLKL